MAVASMARDESTMDTPIDTTVHRWNIATQSLCIIMMTIFFWLRVYARSVVLNGFSMEDWTCLVAWVLGVGYSVIALIMGSYGGGLHIWDVPVPDRIPFQKTVYVTMVMYGPTAFLTKVSLLWIMTRVFRPYRKAVIFIYIFTGIMLAYYIPAVIVKIRICSPIKKFWIPSTEGSCLDEAAIILADAVMSMVSDLIVLTLPLPLTMKLQMPFKKKMRVMAILGAGGLACVSSIVRLVLIVRTGASPDGTYSFMRINMFGNAEIAIGIICACLPSLSALVSRFYHEYSSKKTTGSSDHEMSNQKPSSSGSGRPAQGPARSWSRVEGRCKSRLSQLETGTAAEQDVFAQNPKIETSIECDASPPDHYNHSHYNQQNGMGIVKTVDVSTCVTSLK